MNLLSSSHLYCFYPELAMRSRSLASVTLPGARERQSLYDRCLRYNVSTRCWSFSCGAACASQWRHTKGLADVGVVAWGGLDNTFSVAGNMKLRDDSFHNLLLDSSYKWRIGWCCWNKRCPNAGDDDNSDSYGE